MPQQEPEKLLALEARIAFLESQIERHGARGPGARLARMASATALGALALMPVLASAVTIDTSDIAPGEAISAEAMISRFQQIENSLNAASHVGDIVASALTESQFLEQHGDAWVLANGQNVSGSDYALISGEENVPDLRGVFLRGENGSRADGNENPDDTPLRGLQTDAVGEHQHDILYDHRADITTGGGSWRDLFKETSGASNRTDFTEMFGAAETRPTNVTVNFFIRIHEEA